MSDDDPIGESDGGVSPSSPDGLRTLVRELVSIPSHDDPTAAGDAIESWLRAETDATVERDEHGNVFARTGDPNAPTVALVGHHDVVPPAPSQTAAKSDGEDSEDGENGENDENDENDEERYVVTERDGRLYGRGSADMKGAVAAAMCTVRDADPEGVELCFVSFVGEEDGGVGARAAIDDGFAPEYAVVGEGSTNYSDEGVTDVVVAHKGRRASTLVASGESTHASIPEEGANAVYRACDAVDVVREVEFPETTVMGERVRGSLAVTEIGGGTAWNVVPDRCEVTVDERTVPGERAPLDRTESVEGVDWRVDQDLPPMACADDAFADAVLAAARDAQSGTPEHVVKPHATDAGWLADAGTACVICGAAESGEAHTDTESVSWAVLDRCYRIYRRVAEDATAFA